jgi:hypothetical protein
MQHHSTSEKERRGRHSQPSALLNDYCTPREAAERWTERVRKAGFHHRYTVHSVRKAIQQGRIAVRQRVGNNTLLLKTEVDRVELHPWLRPGAREDTQATCPRCGTLVSQEALHYRTWYWCPACRAEEPLAWQAQRQAGVAHELAESAHLYTDDEPKRQGE